MINIICTLDCKFQEKGVCTLNTVPFYISSLNEKCMYYLPKDEKNDEDIKDNENLT
ncbi:hypothetical protein ACTQYZ_02330 [Anaerofustis sp. LCP19S3_F7]|uniref:hypothetical protein n=1 Tax=Anaerofustis sp. LCP19S3_F7 TaxID=3440247 RepID=UPI003F916CF9